MQQLDRMTRLLELHEKDPSNPFPIYGLALECKKEGQSEKAAGYFEILLNKHSDYVPAYFHYGQLLVDEGQEERARQVLTQGVAAAQRKGDRHALSELEAALTML